jgi:hypothetical protein
MGSTEKLFTPAQLKKLSAKEHAHLKKELRRLLRESPATRKLIKAHGVANVRLKKKLNTSLKQLKTK